MKVGDYVRTKDGYIAKIEEEFKESYLCDNIVEYIYEPLPFISKDKVKEIIIKYSLDIIDLIEVGDYVNLDQINGGIVINKGDNVINTWSVLPNTLKNEDIKNVITREQLLNIKYEVEKL